MSKHIEYRRKSDVHLKALIGQDILVRVERERIDDNHIDGFVVGVSDKLLMMHVLQGSLLQLNGYSALRLSDITSWYVDETFVPRALRLLGRLPVVPGQVVLDDWPSLIEWAQERYPLIMIEAEKKYPGSAFVGVVEKLTQDKLALKTIDPHGQWDAKVEKFSFSSITQVEFGDGYTQALAALVEHESRGDNPPKT